MEKTAPRDVRAKKLKDVRKRRMNDEGRDPEKSEKEENKIKEVMMREKEDGKKINQCISCRRHSVTRFIVSCE